MFFFFCFLYQLKDYNYQCYYKKARANVELIIKNETIGRVLRARKSRRFHRQRVSEQDRPVKRVTNCSYSNSSFSSSGNLNCITRYERIFHARYIDKKNKKIQDFEFITSYARSIRFCKRTRVKILNCKKISKTP